MDIPFSNQEMAHLQDKLQSHCELQTSFLMVTKEHSRTKFLAKTIEKEKEKKNSIEIDWLPTVEKLNSYFFTPLCLNSQVAKT